MAALADARQRLWLPGIALDRRIRVLLVERLERGATDNLDRVLAALIAERDTVRRTQSGRSQVVDYERRQG